MIAAIDVHFVLAFLVALCAAVFSWNALGRRVMSAVVGIQVVSGLALAGVLGASHQPLPHGIWLHIVGAFAALLCYGFASRAGRRPGGDRAALLLSIAGLVCVAATLTLGLRMYMGAA